MFLPLTLATAGHIVFAVPVNPALFGLAVSAALIGIGLLVGTSAPRLASQASGRPPR